jgi:hypothetical protein
MLSGKTEGELKERERCEREGKENAGERER